MKDISERTELKSYLILIVIIFLIVIFFFEPITVLAPSGFVEVSDKIETETLYDQFTIGDIEVGIPFKINSTMFNKTGSTVKIEFELGHIYDDNLDRVYKAENSRFMISLWEGEWPIVPGEVMWQSKEYRSESWGYDPVNFEISDLGNKNGNYFITFQQLIYSGFYYYEYTLTLTYYIWTTWEDTTQYTGPFPSGAINVNGTLEDKDYIEYDITLTSNDLLEIYIEISTSSIDIKIIMGGKVMKNWDDVSNQFNKKLAGTKDDTYTLRIENPGTLSGGDELIVQGYYLVTPNAADQAQIILSSESAPWIIGLVELFLISIIFVSIRKQRKK